MYRVPEKQTGSRMVSNGAQSCFYQYANRLPFRLLSIKLKYLSFFTTFRFAVSFYITFVKAEFFHENLRFQKEKTLRKRCVYSDGDTCLFRFTYTYIEFPFIWQISLDTKMSPLISQMLAFLGTLFILTIKIF